MTRVNGILAGHLLMQADIQDLRKLAAAELARIANPPKSKRRKGRKS